jgi:Cd2+/Zn2+-exporting ATPase
VPLVRRIPEEKKQMAGLLVLEDELRPETAQAVARLNQLGLRTVLVSGDHRTTAERIATEVGISEVYAEALPKQKVEIVRRLQAQRRRVAFVGDGINDGPALAAADIGIAMGLAGTDLAIETAAITLLSDDLSKLPHLINLSRQALQAIRQNLAFSLGILAIAVVLTTFGILTPVTGALLHEFSSIPVISCPSKRMCPDVGRSNCRIVRPVVVFPQPLSPTSPRVSPLAIQKLIPSTAVKLP